MLAHVSDIMPFWGWMLVLAGAFLLFAVVRVAKRRSRAYSRYSGYYRNGTGASYSSTYTDTTWLGSVFGGGDGGSSHGSSNHSDCGTDCGGDGGGCDGGGGGGD